MSPNPTPRSPVRTPTVRSRATVLRLLSGAGLASWVGTGGVAGDGTRGGGSRGGGAGDGGAEPVPLLAHGLTATGDLVVARWREQPAGAEAPTGSGRAPAPYPASPDPAAGLTPMRLDIRLEAATPRVRLLAATAHLFGRIEWLRDAALRRALEGGWLPERVALAASAPYGQLGVVCADEVYLRDSSGVTLLRYDDVVDGAERDQVFPGAWDELAAYEAVAMLPNADLRALHSAVLTADIPGEILAVATPAGGCRHTTGRSFCVDVDALGTTLVAVGIAATTIVHVAWPEPVHDLDQLRRALAALVAHAQA